jgi:osmotically-inducible protein OsmY
MNWNFSKWSSVLLACAAALLLSVTASADYDRDGKKAKKDKDRTAAERTMDAAGDAAIVAAVKSRLLLNEHTSGLDITVEAHEDVVTLSGQVESEEERELAEMIAANTLGVEDVRNKLEVEGS